MLIQTFHYSELSIMHVKVPNQISGNSFSADQSYDDQASDYEDVLEYSSEGESAPNDFSDFLWMENEDQFETEQMIFFEEQELIHECLEAMAEMSLLDEINEIEAEIE